MSIASEVVALIMSEGVDVIAGCDHDGSRAGSILALKHNCSRWQAEAAIRESLRTIWRQMRERYGARYEL